MPQEEARKKVEALNHQIAERKNKKLDVFSVLALLLIFSPFAILILAVVLQLSFQLTLIGFTSTILGVGLLNSHFMKKSKIEANQIQKEFIYPFIYSLEEHKDYISGVTYDEKGDLIIHYVESETEHNAHSIGLGTRLEKSPSGKTVLTFDKVPVFYDLPSGDTPYKSYRYLPEDITGFLKPGNYQEEIHLPQDFARNLDT